MTEKQEPPVKREDPAKEKGIQNRWKKITNEGPGNLGEPKIA